MKLDSYATIVFDCDGVILDSNRVKSESFRTAAMPFGDAAAAALVKHHVSNGGVSRYVKFAYFLETIVPEHAPDLIPDDSVDALESLLLSYAQSVRSALMTCAVAEGLEELRAATREAHWLIVSGGDQEELCGIFAEREIASYFDGGIFGSPDTKDTILARELGRGRIKNPALFLGDSLYDFKAAKTAGLEFVFISGWTEMVGWHQFVTANNVPYVKSLADLPAYLRTQSG
jgi:phosphoglycolate phosphatase-like HAD superfamily hydrolase